MIADNIAEVRQQIVLACERAHRPLDSVTLIAVSKTNPPEAIIEAARAGVQHFGENRPEEAAVKIPQVQAVLGDSFALNWHMIGHVQSRKAKLVAPWCGSVHSVDSLKIAQKLSAAACDSDVTLDVLLQMNVSGEDSKEGFPADDWRTNTDTRTRMIDALQAISALPALKVCGLMTIAPYTDDERIVRPCFVSLRDLRDTLSEASGLALPHLSMGMTDDYPIAIEEGATLVRVGRAIFGER